MIAIITLTALVGIPLGIFIGYKLLNKPKEETHMMSPEDLQTYVDTCQY